MPIQNSVQADTTQCLIDLLAHRNVIGRAQVSGTLVHKARNKLVESVLEGFPKATHVLFIDDDMVFSNEDLDKLLNAGKDVIGGVAVERVPPFQPCVVPFNQDWRQLKKLWEQENPMKVQSVGMGFTLVAVKILEGLLKNTRDLFFFEKDSDYGEDYNFCRLVNVDSEVWVHPAVKLGHISSLPVTMDHFMYNLMNNPTCEEIKGKIFAEDTVQNDKA